MQISDADTIQIDSLRSLNGGDISITALGSITVGAEGDLEQIATSGDVALEAGSGIGGFEALRLGVHAAQLSVQAGSTDPDADVYIYSGSDINVDDTGIRNMAREGWLLLTYMSQLTGKDKIFSESENVLLLQTEKSFSEEDAATLLSSKDDAKGRPVVASSEMLQEMRSTARVGEVLHVSTAEISDSNGIGSDFLYVWLRDGVIIDGQNTETYSLTRADVGSAIIARVGFTDDAGFAEEVTSEGVKVAAQPFHELPFKRQESELLIDFSELQVVDDNELYKSMLTSTTSQVVRPMTVTEKLSQMGYKSNDSTGLMRQSDNGTVAQVISEMFSNLIEGVRVQETTDEALEATEAVQSTDVDEVSADELKPSSDEFIETVTDSANTDTHVDWC